MALQKYFLILRQSKNKRNKVFLSSVDTSTGKEYLGDTVNMLSASVNFQFFRMLTTKSKGKVSPVAKISRGIPDYSCKSYMFKRKIDTTYVHYSPHLNNDKLINTCHDRIADRPDVRVNVLCGETGDDTSSLFSNKGIPSTKQITGMTMAVANAHIEPFQFKIWSSSIIEIHPYYGFTPARYKTIGDIEPCIEAFGRTDWVSVRYDTIDRFISLRVRKQKRTW